MFEVPGTDPVIYAIDGITANTTPPAAGAVGTTVTISGNNFGATQGSSTVTFNGTSATTISSWTATSISAQVPSGATSGNVIVTVGVPSSGVNFTVIPASQEPSITGISPAAGPSSTQVTISGSNFGSSQGSGTVTFNGTPATTIGSWTATSILVDVPTGATSGYVVVTENSAESNGFPFTVASGPVITGISPSSAGPGMTVTISGVNLLGESTTTSSVASRGGAEPRTVERAPTQPTP